LATKMVGYYPHDIYIHEKIASILSKPQKKKKNIISDRKEGLPP